MDSQVNDEFLIWLNKNYGQMGEVKAHRGKIHDYLGMKLNYSKDGKVQIDMTDYVEEMIESFPVELTETKKVKTPADTNLFNVNDDDLIFLTDNEKEIFHTMVAKGIYFSGKERSS